MFQVHRLILIERAKARGLHLSGTRIKEAPSWLWITLTESRYLLPNASFQDLRKDHPGGPLYKLQGRAKSQCASTGEIYLH